MINHKQNTEYEGKIKEAMKERQNTLQYKRQDTIESLSVEVAALGIFDALKTSDIKKLVTKIVEKQPIDVEYNVLKLEVIQQAMALNQTKKDNKTTSNTKVIDVLPLLKLRERALQRGKHPYELLSTKGFIKNCLEEFYN